MFFFSSRFLKQCAGLLLLLNHFAGFNTDIESTSMLWRWHVKLQALVLFCLDYTLMDYSHVDYTLMDYSHLDYTNLDYEDI